MERKNLRSYEFHVFAYKVGTEVKLVWGIVFKYYTLNVRFIDNEARIRFKYYV